MMATIRTIAFGTFPVLAFLAGCHSEPYDVPAEGHLGPRTTGDMVQLTYSTDQDYWPAWTDDGKGILYAFVDTYHRNHRCLGMLPPLGGTRLWELCDNRATRVDSTSSYTGFALDTAGQLLVAEATSVAGQLIPSINSALWLADTAHPYKRVQLFDLASSEGSALGVNWLAELRWTGPNTFLALGQVAGTVHQNAHPIDTVFIPNGVLLRGVIANGHATMQIIPGTDSATGYALANNGATIVFTRLHDLRLATVPVAGGTVSPPPIVRTVVDTGGFVRQEIAGLSCRGSVCLVAIDQIITFGAYLYFGAASIPDCPSPPGQICQVFGGVWPLVPHALHRISLTTGADDIVVSDGPTYATPGISPDGNSVVMQIGGLWGHLQTHASTGVDGTIWLVKGLALH